jgi:PPOX class probable F420-dependent enzyme
MPQPTPSASHQDLLDRPLFAHLATIRSDGAPQSGLMWFAWDGERARFSHTRTRQKLRNQAHEPRVSFHLVDPDNPYRTLEVRGRVESIEADPDATFYRSLHRSGRALARIPDGRSLGAGMETTRCNRHFRAVWLGACRSRFPPHCRRYASDHRCKSEPDRFLLRPRPRQRGSRLAATGTARPVQAIVGGTASVWHSQPCWCRRMAWLSEPATWPPAGTGSPATSR